MKKCVSQRDTCVRLLVDYEVERQTLVAENKQLQSNLAASQARNQKLLKDRPKRDIKIGGGGFLLGLIVGVLIR